MPLDHINGETVEGLPPVYRVVPVKKYQEQTGLLTEIQEVRGNKFKQEVIVELPIWEAAFRWAQQAFMHNGAAPGDLNYDVICQEYPDTGHVLFLFNAVIKGQELFVPATFELTEGQIADLSLRGLWDEKPKIVLN